MYTREAHPDDGPEDRRKASATGGWKMRGNKIKIDNHKSYKDRLKAAKDLKQAGKDHWVVLVDAMDDRTHKDWGELPNMGYLIDPKGLIAHKWAWIQSSVGRHRNGDDGTTALETLLKQADTLKPYSIADDPQVPLYGVREGEWIEYGKETVQFTPAGKDKVKRGEEVIELKAPELNDTRANVRRETLKVGKVELTCIVMEGDGTETWYCARLPGDGIARVVREGKVVQEVTDAGFKPGESCLVEYDPEPKK